MECRWVDTMRRLKHSTTMRLSKLLPQVLLLFLFAFPGVTLSQLHGTMELHVIDTSRIKIDLDTLNGYVDGERHGPWVEWITHEQLFELVLWHGVAPDGTSIHGDSKQRLAPVTVYAPVIKSSGMYRGGIRTGQWLHYYEDFKVAAIRTYDDRGHLVKLVAFDSNSTLLVLGYSNQDDALQFTLNWMNPDGSIERREQLAVQDVPY